MVIPYIRYSVFTEWLTIEGAIFMKIHFHSFITTIYEVIDTEYRDREWVYRVSDFIEFNKLCLLCQCSAIFRISRFFHIHATPHILFTINFRMPQHSKRKRDKDSKGGNFTIHKCKWRIKSNRKYCELHNAILCNWETHHEMRFSKSSRKPKSTTSHIYKIAK